MSDYLQGNKDNAITVPFSDDDVEKKDDDLTEDPPASASPQQLSEHKRKKAERTRRMLEEGKQSKEEVARLKAEQDALKQELARVQGYLAAQQNQPRQQSTETKDEYEKRLDALEEERAAAYAAAQAEVKEGKMTAERAAYWDKKGRALDERRAETIVERQLARTRAAEEQRRQQEDGRQFWRHRHPEVYQNPQAYRWAEGRAAMMIAETGRDMTQADIDAVLEEAKVKFKLGKQTASATERARMSGIPSSSSGGGGAGKGDGMTFSNPKIRNMALAAYDHLPEHEALKAWAQKTGKRLRDKKIL